MSAVLQVRVDDEVKASIEAAAAARGQNRSEWLRTAVDHALAAQTSGGGENGAVGTSPVPPTAGAGEQLPPAPPEPASPRPPAAPPATSPAPAPRATVNCPDCGAPDGQHHGYCIRVTGVPPVREVRRTTELEEKPVEMQPLEDREQFIARRREELLAEGQSDVMATAIAEGEWRKRIAPPEPPPPGASVAPPAVQTFAPEACGSCGLMKSPTEQCRDCGARPTIIL